MQDDASKELLSRWRAGDESAAAAIFHRYLERLVALARARMSRKLARRLDPEDVVQSAYRSFFSGARAGQFELHGTGDLWRLLVGITLNKLRGQIEVHTAGKRAIDRERSADAAGGRSGLPVEELAREPSPSEAVALSDELEHLLGTLDVRRRQMLEMLLRGHTVDEVGTQTGRSTRTVRRFLEELKSRLEMEHQRSLAS